MLEHELHLSRKASSCLWLVLWRWRHLNTTNRLWIHANETISHHKQMWKNDSKRSQQLHFPKFNKMLLQGNTVTTQAKLGTTWETSQSALASAQTNPRQKPHRQITSSWFTDRWIKALCWFQEELPHWLSETGVVMENVVLSRGFQVTSLECPFTRVCVGPAFVWASLPKHSNPQSREVESCMDQTVS